MIILLIIHILISAVTLIITAFNLEDDIETIYSEQFGVKEVRHSYIGICSFLSFIPIINLIMLLTSLKQNKH